MRRLILGLCLLAAWIVPLSVMAEDTRFEPPGDESETLVIGSVTDLVFIEPLIRAFQRANPSTAVIYRQMTSLDLYAAVADACEKGEFFADTVISSAIPEQVRLVNDGCSEPFRFSLPPDLPDWASWRNELVGLTYEPAVIVYDREGLGQDEVPRNRFELVDLLRQTERFRGRIGTYDIQSSGVGYIFAFEDASQASTWGRLLESLGQNRAQLFCCSSDVIDGVRTGRLVLGYNVLGSYALARQEEDPRIGIVFPSDYTLALSRAALVSRHARNKRAANALIALALTDTGQRLLSGPSRLLSSLNGPDMLNRLDTGDGPSAEEAAFRPIALSPALLVGLDRAKRKAFLDQWRKSFQADGGE
ncbi:ABC transporter substrate-binding protein [Nitratireductor kimnyeongensis]|uniref:ABC transporter substrate-binding protein n=1 Tax=Nitratireductor kimnyeongensis TaxID=430679 RepID=A0ABW0T3R4_9HYPH|nr:ABC transporter substrate-binding protein [Nitratireductor kimnyeongensis]QZZ35387.1 ABC transporter substrate-binding protein [Nitratireductor kimnyeongensis]